METDRVEIPGPWVFEPAHILVTQGTTVTFVNHGGADHTVTFRSLPVDLVIAPGASATHTFADAGTFEYYCKYHPPGMAGSVRVDAPQAAPDAAASPEGAP